MVKTVILAEKPSQAQAYAQAFKQSSKKDGYFEITDPLFSGPTVITFGFGHLVELAQPGEYAEKWQKWSLHTLPIFPQEYRFQVADAKKKQFHIVERLLQRADVIIVATDSDREGENIAWSIIHQAQAFSEEKTYQRLWINSMEKDVIYKGFQELRSGMDYYPFYKEAQTRQIADWLIGMNGSQLYTLSLQKRGISGVFSIGRVQTPTLAIVHKRQKEIENFKPEPFFELDAKVQAENGEFIAHLDPHQRFKTKEEAQDYLRKVAIDPPHTTGKITKVEKKKKKTPSPLLFSLSSLQSKINQIYKASASQTLEAVQKLYEAKLLTYPRTDTPFITNNEFSYLVAQLEKYTRFLGYQGELPQQKTRKRYVDDKKVQEHHAIIPTKQVPTAERFARLPQLQQQIYQLVMQTTIAMFAPDYTYEETVIHVAFEQANFKAIGKVPLEEGWKVLFPKSKKQQTKEEDLLPKVKVDEAVSGEILFVEKKTQAPKPFTEGTLLTAMKTANKQVEDEEASQILKEIEGIGTEATRASIIETLKHKEYIRLEKNQLFVTKKGALLSEALGNDSLLASAEMTAKWERYLKKIGQQTGSQENFLANIQKFILHLLQTVPNEIAQLQVNTADFIPKPTGKVIGKCPRCQHELIEKKGFYGCIAYPNCRFTLSTHFRRKKLTKKNIEELLVGKETLITGIKTEEKATYQIKIHCNEKGYLNPVSQAETT